MHDYEKFKCAFCDHVAASAQNKVMHEKRIHLGMDCKTCRRLFESEAEKAEHACAEPERFRCDQCEKSYKAVLGIRIRKDRNVLMDLNSNPIKRS